MELSELLEQNFLRYEGEDDVPSQIHSYLSSNFKELRNLEKDDLALKTKAKDRWYVPDPNKAGDLEKLRERTLMREFEEAVAGGRHVDAGWPDSAYSVSKISLNAFTRIFHRELTDAGRKVFVNSVSPGWVRTDMGGDTAPRSVADGASGVVWAVTAPVAGGQSHRDGRVVRW